MEESCLPRLLYIGDVPVESTVAGSALLYRLLQKYPVEKLHIIEGNIHISQVETRLYRVNYGSLYVGKKRLLHSRLTPIYNLYLLLTAKKRISQLIETANNFKPEAILTVTHGFSWLTAAELAKQLGIPLHLVIHDDIISIMPVPSWSRAKFDRLVKNIYIQAHSRLCVSPYMVEAYSQRYGVTGSVMYPSRALDIERHDTVQQNYNSSDKPLVFAYAGSLNTPGQANTLASLASVLQQFKSKLIIYASLKAESAAQIGLDRSNIELRPLIPYRNLIDTLRQEANVLFAPMDFSEHYKTHMQLCFPSKLADYTAIGLPILIWGPPYCSAVNWARENPDTAEIVDTPNIQALEIAVKKLIENPKYLEKLAMNTLDIGEKYFAHTNVYREFYQAISQLEKIPKPLF
ncbi:hypothetical protein Xen7305DRAFT_00018690 [Xenococcus sp. PCC 7305]|uniref:glycosyltransferase n=1 Tax=Xenococcus sp. PCC 7305 TaxID=102125 RepID=UPI0002AC3FE2|nr:glycosyltransferase [Xenococcus sp. PCC 7305]ELS02157.1 hypothetical protein Xen7305DRAFT_00018690 [Xenococcus sp. PCC 7305]